MLRIIFLGEKVEEHVRELVDSSKMSEILGRTTHLCLWKRSPSNDEINVGKTKSLISNFVWLRETSEGTHLTASKVALASMHHPTYRELSPATGEGLAPQILQFPLCIEAWMFTKGTSIAGGRPSHTFLRRGKRKYESIRRGREVSTCSKLKT